MRHSTLRYNEPKSFQGSKPPLFDRLVNDRPDESVDTAQHFHLNENELIDSIIREVSNILNTRRGARQAFYDEIEDDSLYFGLPSLFGLIDFQSIDAMSASDQYKISSLCEQTISTFEPRVKNVSVVINGYNITHQSLDINVAANVIINRQVERVQFPVRLEQKAK